MTITTYEVLTGRIGIDTVALLRESGYKAEIRSRRSPQTGPGLNGWFIITDADKDTVSEHIAELFNL